MLSGEAMIICLIVVKVMKISLYEISWFSGSYNHSENKIKFELDLSN